MAGKYQRYPEYKDSGVEWLGAIPAHWKSTQIKYGFDVVLGKMLQSTQKNPSDVLKPYLRAANIQPFGVDISDVRLMWFSPAELKKLRLKPMDVLISEGGDVGRVAIWKDEITECFIQNAINRARPLVENNAAFLAYWIKFIKAQDYIDILCNKATIAHYTADKVQTTPIVLPSYEEQKAIANFLDHETAKIDALIEKQEKLIELLKEKRQAVISHAVTKGLNPDVPMKDSGIEWLGEVPEHWCIKRLKHISPKIGVGLVINPSTYTQDEGVYFIFGGNVREYSFDLKNARRMSTENSNKLVQSKLQKDDLVTVRVGYPGITSVVPEHLEGANCASVVIIRRGLYNSNWLCALMNSWVGRQQVDVASYGAAQKQFNIADAVEFYFPFPPVDEQNSLAHYIETQLNKFENLSLKATKQISLLKERKSSLISAAVTGKIDVRNWQSENKEVAHA